MYSLFNLGICKKHGPHQVAKKYIKVAFLAGSLFNCRVMLELRSAFTEPLIANRSPLTPRKLADWQVPRGIPPE